MGLRARVGERDGAVDDRMPANDSEPLRDCLRMHLGEYFSQLGDQRCGDLYRLVVREVEAPLLEMTLDHTCGNLSRAAEVLGINRATLRRKLRQYGLARS